MAQVQQQPHSHPHPPGPQGPQMRPPPGAMPPQIPIDPAMLALLDTIPTHDVPFQLLTLTPQLPPNAPPGAQGKPFHRVVCKPHAASPCEACGLDFEPVNSVHMYLRYAPADAVPPPPNMMPPPQRAEQFKQLKEAGNNAFKAGQFGPAIQTYSKAADSALNRGPWEPSQLGREELVIAMCNRSAAFAFVGQWTQALADAECVVGLKRPWTKGHFRKARALVGLERFEDARQAIIDGLQYEPNDKELNQFLAEVDQKIYEAEAEFDD
ncbi:hypothetical protein IAT38_006187 [Cryptococcus sp. DSM 104549]